MTRRAVVLFNLGGPDSLEAVQPFLFNLFRDPAIIALPNPLRWLIARLIAARRAPTARQIYARMGNTSPLLANTIAQADALEGVLGPDHRVFVAMRYWRPAAAETAAAVKAWRPDEVVLLPLYPQFSSTTTGSSLTDWRRAAVAAGLAAPVRALCCYPQDQGFVHAVAQAVAAALKTWPAAERLRVLFSAHGLPKKIVARGDPYAWQVERTVAAVLARLGRPALDAVLCFQSRVGPLEWLGPSTDAEIRRAGREGVGLVVVPIAVVSEHSETLVELDIEYRHLAEVAGVPRYVRVPAVGTAPDFIAGLAALVRAAPSSADDVACPAGGRRLCPGSLVLCPCAEPAR
jgi:ferrochelatase